MELELLLLFIFHSLGVAVFGKFESETAWWRLVLKWALLLALTYGLHIWFGQRTAVIVLGSLMVAGLTFHILWCRAKGIHPTQATPRKRYYELRGWEWKE